MVKLALLALVLVLGGPGPFQDQSWSASRSAAVRTHHLTAVSGADTVMPYNAQMESKRTPVAPVATPRSTAGNRPATALHLYSSGTYTDCEGVAPLKAGVWRDTCIVSTTYLVSHRWSTGAKFFALRVGSKVIYAGRTYTVVSRYTAPNTRSDDTFSAPLVLQTCWNVSGSIWLIIELR